MKIDVIEACTAEGNVFLRAKIISVTLGGILKYSTHHSVFVKLFKNVFVTCIIDKKTNCIVPLCENNRSVVQKGFNESEFETTAFGRG